MVLDMTMVAFDPAFVEPLTALRATTGGYVNGIYQPPATTPFSFVGSSYPSTGEELRNLPEGERNKTLRTFCTAQQMQTTRNNVPADIITDHLGQDWKVIHVGDWSIHGFYTCIAEALPVGTANNPVNVPNQPIAGMIWDFDFAQSRVLGSGGQSVADGDDAISIIGATPSNNCATIDTTITTVNPKWFDDPKITFDGNGAYTFGTLPGMASLLLEFTAFFVLRPDSVGPFGVLCSGDTAAGDGMTIKVSTELEVSRRTTTLYSATSGGTIDTAAPNILVAQVAQTGVSARLVNAAGDTAGNTPITSFQTLSAQPYTCGSCAGNDIFSGDMFRSFMYGRVLSAAEIDQNVDYLKGVYGI